MQSLHVLKLQRNSITMEGYSFIDYGPFTLQAVVPQLEVLLGGTTPQVAPFRPSCSHYRQTATDWTQCLTVNNSRMTVLKTLVTVKQPPLTLTHLW